MHHRLGNDEDKLSSKIVSNKAEDALRCPTTNRVLQQHDLEQGNSSDNCRLVANVANSDVYHVRFIIHRNVLPELSE